MTLVEPKNFKSEREQAGVGRYARTLGQIMRWLIWTVFAQLGQVFWLVSNCQLFWLALLWWASQDHQIHRAAHGIFVLIVISDAAGHDRNWHGRLIVR